MMMKHLILISVAAFVAGCNTCTFSTAADKASDQKACAETGWGTTNYAINVSTDTDWFQFTGGDYPGDQAFTVIVDVQGSTTPVKCELDSANTGGFAHAATARIQESDRCAYGFSAGYGTYHLKVTRKSGLETYKPTIIVGSNEDPPPPPPPGGGGVGCFPLGPGC